MVVRLYQNKEWLFDKYVNKEWSQTEIASFCGVTQGTIYQWMKRHSIKARSGVSSHVGIKNGCWVDSPIKDRIWLYNKYVVQKLSFREIAQEADVSLRTVARYIEKFEIQPRQGSDAIKAASGSDHHLWNGGSFCINCARENTRGSVRCQFCHFNHLRANPRLNPNWKGGVSSINSLLREYSNSTWRISAFKRDSYACQECGDSSGGNLNAHHIIPFVTIRDQLILENRSLDFSDEKQKVEFIKVAKSDIRVNDINNGITLCEGCHKGEHSRIKEISKRSLYTYRADVIEVKDGDSITLDVDLGFGLSKEIEARLYGINAPEIRGKEKEHGFDRDWETINLHLM